MTSLFTTMFLASAVTSPAGGFALPGDELKCQARGGAPDMPDAVVLLDHKVLEGDREDARIEITSLGDDIAVVQVVCWRWVEAQYGIKVRQGATYVLTKGWIEQTRKDRIAALEALVSAQDRHRELTGKYAARVEDMPDFGALSDYGLPDHLQLDLSRTNGGWKVRLEPEEGWSTGAHADIKPAYRCFAFAGEAPPGWEEMRLGGQPGPAERKPECFEPRTLVLSMKGS